MGLDTAGADDAEQQGSALSSSASAGAQVGAVPSGATTEGGGTGLLWGAAALAAVASATAYGLSRRRAREEYIREMRERAAEMSSPEARQARLTSLWNAAQARVAPIRAAVVSAAGAAAALAAAEAGRRRGKALLRTSVRMASRAETPRGDDGDPVPTPTYPAPTATSEPPSASPAKTPTATPSATMKPSQTATPSATPSPQPMLPTNLPGTPVIDPEVTVGSVVLDFIDSFLPFGEPSPLDAYGSDPLTPFESVPYTRPFVPIARVVLTVLATVRHLLRPLTGLDPTYPLRQPVPHEPSSKEDGTDGVS